jgi:hypothetical protein
VGLRTGRDRDAFQDPRTFTGWADGAPFDTLAYGLIPRPRPDLGDRLNSDPTTVPPADSLPSFEDRFSAAYSPAPTAIGDGRGIGSLLDIAATYAGGGGVGTSPTIVPPAFFGPSIPFASRPSGSLTAPGGSSLLDPAPMDLGAPGSFSTGGRFVPRSLPPQPLYPTGSLVPVSNVRVQERQGSLDDRSGNRGLSVEDADRYRSSVLRELQRYRQLAASGVAATPSSATSNLGIPQASSAVGNEAGGPWGGVLKWIAPASLDRVRCSRNCNLAGSMARDQHNFCVD